MDLTNAVATLTASVTNADTGIPGLIGDMAPLIALGVVVALFFGLLSRALPG